MLYICTVFYFQDFLNHLKDHILVHLHRANFAGDRVEFTDTERRSIQFTGGRLYMHASLHINYTTYDVHQAQDVLNCSDLDRERSNVIVYANEDGLVPHPFWYAQIL
jgi:hypothetical protein